MCLLVLAFQRLPACPVFVLHNRDESRARPSSPPERIDTATGTAWYGGRDLERGGTWLGVNAHGLLVAVTNRRREHPPVQPRSRGLLCRDALETTRTPEDAAQQIDAEWHRNPYDGFNMLLANRTSAVFVEAVDAFSTHPLERGLYAVTNGPFGGADDRRAAGALDAFTPMLDEPSLDFWLKTSRSLCRRNAGPDRDAACITGGEWGTVSSTIVALTDEPQAARYLFADGPPDTTPYDDRSTAVRDLLTERPGIEQRGSP